MKPLRRLTLSALAAVTFAGTSPAAPPPARLLLTRCTLLTLAPGADTPLVGYLLVDADGRIATIGAGEPPPDIVAELVVDARDKIALPGFVSARSQLGPRQPEAGEVFTPARHDAVALLRVGVTTLRPAGPDDAPPDAQRARFDGALASGAHLVPGPAPRAAPESTVLAATNNAPVSTLWTPLTEGRLGAALLDVPGLLRAGRNVALALDGPLAGGSADPFEAMRLGLYALRFRDQDPRGLQPIDLLRLHTIGAARALGVADQVGSLEVGKLGDVVLVDPHWPDTGPVTDVAATLVLACDRLNVAAVFVSGRLVAEPNQRATPIAPAAASETSPQLVVTHARLVPLDGTERAPFEGYLVVGPDGRIADLGPGEPPPALAAAPHFDAAGRIVMPGFVSGHNHLVQSVTRGRAAGSWVTEWGRSAAGPTRPPSPGDTRAFVLHGSVDMLLGGITTVYNYASMGRDYASLTETLDGMLDSGGRFVYGTTLPRWSEPYSRAELVGFFRDLLAYGKTARGHERLLKLSIASMAMRWGEDASREEFELLKAFPELQLDIQMHYLEPPPNVPRTYYERSNFAWLKKYGVLGPNLTFAHFIHPTEEILLAAAAAHACMIWNPLSNGRLGSGLSDIPRYRQLGLVVGMGIDGQASADLSDPFQNLRVGLYGLRLLRADPAVLSPREMLQLHTLDTARAIRVDRDVGSLTVGKFADFIVVDPDEAPPAFAGDVYATLVYACSRANITDVFVGGRAVVRDRVYQPFDLKPFQADTRDRLARPVPAS